MEEIRTLSQKDWNVKKSHQNIFFFKSDELPGKEVSHVILSHEWELMYNFNFCILLRCFFNQFYASNFLGKSLWNERNWSKHNSHAQAFPLNVGWKQLKALYTVLKQHWDFNVKFSLSVPLPWKEQALIVHLGKIPFYTE